MDKHFDYLIVQLTVRNLQNFLPKASASPYVSHKVPSIPWHGFKRTHSNYPWFGPMPVIYVSGSPYERGFQYGKQAAKLIPIVAKSYKERYLTGNSYNGKEELFKENLLRYEHMLGKVLGQEYLDEMNGISDGSEVPYEDILLIMARSEFGATFPSEDKRFQIEDDERCISWSAWGEATAEDNGKMIVTHNSEGNRWPSRNELIVVHEPTNGYRFMSPVFAGELAHHRGYFNEAGVFVSLSFLKGSKPEDFNFIPYCPIIRYIAQYASSAREGFAMLQNLVEKGNFGAGATNIQIVDKNEALCAQVTPDHLSQPRIAEKAGFVLSTDEPPLEEMLPYLTTELKPSPKREGWLKVLRENYGRIDVWHAMQMLGSHYNYGCGEIKAGSESLCIHGDYTRFTIGSVVALPEEKGMFIASGNPCEANELHTWRYLAFDKPITIADLPGLFVQGLHTRIVTAMDNDITAEVIADKESDLVLVGNSLVNNLTAYYDIESTLLPIEIKVSVNEGFIKSPGNEILWQSSELIINGTKVGEGPASKTYDTDAAVIYVMADGDRYVLALYGFGYKGTIAASLYLSDYSNLTKLRGQAAVLLWSDKNKNGLVEMEEIEIIEIF